MSIEGFLDALQTALGNTISQMQGMGTRHILMMDKLLIVADIDVSEIAPLGD